MSLKKSKHFLLLPLARVLLHWLASMVWHKATHGARATVWTSVLLALCITTAGCNATPHPEPVLLPGLNNVDAAKIALTLEIDGVRIAGAPRAVDTLSRRLDITYIQAGLQAQTVPAPDGSFDAFVEGADLVGTFRLQARSDDLRSAPADITAIDMADGYPVGITVGAHAFTIVDCLTLPWEALLYASDGFSAVQGTLEISNGCEQSLEIMDLRWVNQNTAFNVTSPSLPLNIEALSINNDIEVAYAPNPNLPTYDILLITFQRAGQPVDVTAVTVEALGFE